MSLNKRILLIILILVVPNCKVNAIELKEYAQFMIEIKDQNDPVIDYSRINEIDISYDIKNNTVLFDIFSRNVEFGKDNLIIYYKFEEYIPQNPKTWGNYKASIEKEYYKKWANNLFLMNKNRIIYEDQLTVIGNPAKRLTTTAIKILEELASLETKDIKRSALVGLNLKYDYEDLYKQTKIVNLDQQCLFDSNTPFITNKISRFFFPFDITKFEIIFGSDGKVKDEVKINHFHVLPFFGGRIS